jgi:hypothetical protein
MYMIHYGVAVSARPPLSRIMQRIRFCRDDVRDVPASLVAHRFAEIVGQ